ncbi:phage tail spike protein [Halalkalibacterium halodurans]|uniref:phage tail spike protein n=1 Tax=Halalkalibacterium halodurans TaxID=86665 RepID=UPI0006A9F0BD|nr:phage tail spike protein [Halalkalibacterium halodurans]
MTTPIPQIHIADGQSDRVLDVITDRWIIEDEHRQSLEDTLETFNFTTFGDQRFSQWLEKRNRLIIPNEDGQFVEFIIQESVKIHDENGLSIEVYSSASYLDLKKAKIIEPQTLSQMTPLAAANNAVSGTEWQVGVVEASGFRTFDIENYTNPYALLKRIANEFELELRFRVETNRHKVTARIVDLVERIGEWKGREVEFGKDLQGVRRFERNENIVTALLGLGPEPTEEGENRLEIWVKDDDALQRWGRNGKHLVDHYEPSFTDEEPTLQRLKVLTENELEKRINSAIEYEVDVADIENFAGVEGHAIRFGDTIKIKDTKFNPPLYIEARVFEQSRSIVDPTQKTIKLGDFREFTEEEVMAIWRQLQLEIQNKISLAELFNHTYSKPQVDEKDQAVYQDGTQYTDQRSDQVKQEASQDATEKANQAEDNAKQYTDDVAIIIEQRTNDFVQEYAEKKIAQGISPPSNPSVGDLWIDVSQDPHMWKRWNGSQWEPLERTNLDQMLGELQTEQIANGAIISDKLADLAVTLDKIAENSIDTSKILDDAIDAAKIAAGAVETDALAELSVTDDKIANIHADKITAGRINAERIQIGNGTEFADGYDPTKIEIGGRNLIIRSTEEKGTWINLSGQVVSANNHSTSDYIPVKPNTDYMFTKSDSNLADDAGFFRWAWYDEDKNYISRQANSSNEFLWTTPNNVHYVRISYPDDSYPKLEKGNKATDWTPAPEDERAYADAVAQDGKDAKQRVTLWQYEDTTFIDGGSIFANTVTANQIAAGTITADEIASNAITTAKINANAITTAKIAAGAVDTNQLAANAVIADKIAANAVTTAKIAAGAVNADKIAAGTITSDLISTAGLDAGVIKFGTMSGERIQAGTITANQLGANSVTAAKIATNAVTSAKIEAGAVTASKISVNSLSAVSANLGTITAGDITGVNITGATINGGTITQTSADGSVKLDNTGLTVSSNSGAKILANISNLGGNHGDDLSLTFIDQNGNVGMEIFDYYVDSVIRTSRRLNLVGGTLGIGIDGTGATVPDFGTSVDGGLFINASGFSSNTGVGFPDRNIISMLDDTLTVYANRANGLAFQVRSHSNGSGLRNDFIVTALGNVQCPGAYDNTTGSAANVRINSNGTLSRSTSAKKYKQDIEVIDMSDGYAERLLNLCPKSWYDKAEVERNGGSTDGLKRYFGLIAEDVADVGLSEYVTYENGEIESIEYDRLWTPLIPIVRDHADQINWLKIEVEYLKHKIKQLEGESDE